MQHRTLPSVRSIGANAIDTVLRLGYAARFIGLSIRKYTIVQLPRRMKVLAVQLDTARVETPVRPWPIW